MYLFLCLTRGILIHMAFTRIRKKQKSVALYTDVNFRKNEPPVWRTKRYKRMAAEIQKAAENDNNILEALKSECLRRLENKVMECLRKKQRGYLLTKRELYELKSDRKRNTNNSRNWSRSS